VEAADFMAAARAAEVSTVLEADSTAAGSPQEATWVFMAAGGRSAVFTAEASLEAAADGAVGAGEAEDGVGVEAGVGEVVVGDGAGDLVGAGRGGVGDIRMLTTDTRIITPILLMATTRLTPTATTIRIRTTGTTIRHPQIRMRGRGERRLRINTGRPCLGGPGRHSDQSSSQRRNNREARRI